MSELAPLIADLALILIGAGVMTLLFKKLKQPLVLGYIVAGILAGPNIKFLPTVVDRANIHTKLSRHKTCQNGHKALILVHENLLCECGGISKCMPRGLHKFLHKKYQSADGAQWSRLYFPHNR